MLGGPGFDRSLYVFLEAFVNTGRPQYHCHACRGLIALERRPGRGDDCPHCGAELHVCLNCAWFDASLSRGCRENQADDVRDKARANFCGWFTFRQQGHDADDGRDAARQAAAAFFGSATTSSEPNLMGGLLDRREPAADNPVARFFEPERKAPDEARREADAAFDGLFGRKK